MAILRTYNAIILILATLVVVHDSKTVSTFASAFTTPMVNQQRGMQRKTRIALLQSKKPPVFETSSQDDALLSQDSSQSRSIKPVSSLGQIFAIVLPLLLVYISNQWSRSSLYYLVDFSTSDTANAFTAMNVDIGFSEAQYGALASVAFTALYAIASLFAGGFADRYDRKLLTIGSTLMWSAATFATALSTSGDYNQVLVARIIMGLAAAFTTPSAYTLIRDLVSKERASLANSFYGSGVYLGGGLSSLCILLDNKVGWRSTYDIIASFGVLSAILAVALLPRDPKVGIETNPNNAMNVMDKNGKTAKVDNGKQNNPSQLSDVVDILSIPKIQWLFAGSFFRFCSGLCIGVWAAPYFKLAFPDDSSSYAVTNALIVGLCGVTSGVVGGWFADKAAIWARDSGMDSNTGRLAVPILGSLLAVPAWYFTAHSLTFDYAMAWLAIEYLVAECWFGPTVAVLQSVVGKSQGGTAQGLFTLTGALGNLAPSLLGIVYGQQTSFGESGNGEILSNLIANAVCAGYLLSAVCFTMSSATKTPVKIET